MDLVGNNVLLITFGALAVYFLAVPLITKFTFSMEAETTLVEVDMDEPLDAQTDKYLQQMTDELTALGFEPVCLASVPQMMSNVRAWLKLLINRQTDDTALIEVFFVKEAGKWKMKNECVEFSTEYSDGTEITTGNQHVISVWPIADHKTVSMFSGVQDLGWLYRGHQSICQWKAPNKRKEIDIDSKFGGDAVASLAYGMNREHIPAIEAGYLRYRSPPSSMDSGGSPNPYAPPSAESVPRTCVATLKGAYLMTWQLLWPISRLMKWHRIRQSHKRLRESGFQR